MLTRAMRAVGTFISNDSMSISLFALFLLCVGGQSFTGWAAYDQALRQGHEAAISYGHYLRTGNFLDGALSNWQAAVLQLAVLVSFSAVLRQKGAAHSRKSAAETQPANHRTVQINLELRPTLTEWLYANSLSLAFFVLFVASFMLHALFGTWKNNEDLALRHLPPTPFGAYIGSAGFWFTAFQTWEAEFAAIGLYIVLSIFLRQQNSSESKPVGSSDQQTGGANE